MPTKERKPKESVSIVVRKDIGRGIVKYLRLPRIKVRKVHSFLKHVWYRIPQIPGMWIQVVLIISAILYRGFRRPESGMKGRCFLPWQMGVGFQL